MSRKIEVSEYVAKAEKIAAKNGGYLPTMSKLWDDRQSGIVAAIRLDRAPFEHILPKMGRGRDKTKYAYVQAHIDEDDDALAKSLDVSRTTIKNWKREIRESEFRSSDSHEAPDDATIEELSRFIVKNLPEGWSLDVKYASDGCFVALYQPSGTRCGVEEAYGAGLPQSVLTHVNYARAKAGMHAVGWS